jgi:cytochrome P450
MSDAECFSCEGNLGALNDSYCAEARDILSGGVDWLKIPQVNGAEGDTHARLRKVMRDILTPGRVRAMEPSVRSNVTALIESFQQDGQCELVQQFSYPLPVQVIFDIIGFTAEEHDLKQLALWSDDTFRLWLVPLTPEEQVTCAKHAVQFQQYIRDLLDDRRRAPRDDLLTEFARELDRADARVSEEEVVMMFPMNLIGAGHETTKAALTNAVYHLLAEPARWQGIVDHPDTIPSAVEETLRFDGSVFAWFRTVIQETTLGGQTIKAGDKIMGVFGSANHDETKFENPHQFCPGRPKNPKQMTFSTGRHFCLGAPVARLEMKVALEELSTRLPGLRLAPDYELDYMASLATRVLNTLDLQWDPAS